MLIRLLALLAAGSLLGPLHAENRVLIVADEFPAMRVLAQALESGAAPPGLECVLAAQEAIPDRLASFQAVFVYVHRDLEPGPERALIAYAKGGGRLVLLHHSISSGKRKNQEWFPFLGVELPTGEVASGGYQWIEGVPLTVFPTGAHFITTHQIVWPRSVEKDAGGRGREALTLEDSEVYLNHRLSSERTVLLGLRHEDPASGRVTVQETAGWYRRAGGGWVFYFMPGHSAKEFESPVYRQILVNTLNWEPAGQETDEAQ